MLDKKKFRSPQFQDSSQIGEMSPIVDSSQIHPRIRQDQRHFMFFSRWRCSSQTLLGIDQLFPVVKKLLLVDVLPVAQHPVAWVEYVSLETFRCRKWLFLGLELKVVRMQNWLGPLVTLSIRSRRSQFTTWISHVAFGWNVQIVDSAEQGLLICVLGFSLCAELCRESSENCQTDSKTH